MIRVQFHVFWNSYSSLMWSFKSLWSQMRFVVEVVIIGGSLHGYLGASCSGYVFSVPVISVSMSVALSGVKNLRVNTAFGGRLDSCGCWDFLAVCKVLLEICLLCLFTSWKMSSWAVDSTYVLFTASFCPACALTFNSFSVTE
jgi:hypothetical protein